MTTFGEAGMVLEPKDHLKQLLHDSDVYTQQSAQSAILLTEDYEAGNLSRDEYVELMGDITDMQRLDQEVQDFERKRQIAKALDIIRQVVGLVKVV